MSEIDRELEAAWRAASKEQPPAALDASIRAAARRAVDARPGKTKSWWRVKTHWAPLAAAAMVTIIAVGIVQLTPPEQVTPGVITERAAPPQTAEQDSRKPSAPPPTIAEPARRDAALATDELARSRDVEDARKKLAQSPAPTQATSNAAPQAEQEKKRASTVEFAAKEEQRQLAAAPEGGLAAKLKTQGAGTPAPAARSEPFPAAQAPAERGQPAVAATAPARALSRSEPFPAAEPSRIAADAPAPTAPATAPALREASPEATTKQDAADDKGPANAGLAKVTTLDQARAKDAAAPRPAEEWIKLIRRLRAEGKNEDAAKELAAFCAVYKERADELLPADLRAAKP